MIRILVLLCLLLPFAASAEAPRLDASGLSAAQVEEIQKTIAAAKHQNTATVIREEASEWATLGVGVGKALVAVAKELGIAAADFAQTPLGKAVLVVLFLKMFGGVILGGLAGLFIMGMSTYIWWYITKRILTMPKYEVKPVLWGLWQKRIRIGVVDTDKSYNSRFSDWEWWAMAILVIGNLGGAIGIAVAASHV